MQINLQSPILKESFKYFGWVLLFVFLWSKGCSGSVPQPQITKVVIPEVKGSFKAFKPEQKPVSSKMEPSENKNNFGQNLSKKENEFLQNQITLLLAENGKLKQSFINAPDSMKIKLYDKCMQLNSFTHTWDNDTINATASGIVRGEIQSIALKWKIKPISVQFPQPKQTVFRLLAGGGVGINKELNQLTYFATVGYQNAKGNVTSLQYQKFGNSEFVTVGKIFSIWNYKK